MLKRSPGPAILLLLACLLMTSLSSSATGLNVDPQVPYQPVTGDNIQYLTESNQALAIEDIISANHSEHWQSISGTANFGYTTNTHWYHIQVAPSAMNVTQRLLEIDYPLLDHIEFYKVRNGEIRNRVTTGDHYPFSSRALKHRTFVFPVSIGPMAPTDIYLRVTTSGSHQLPLILWEPESFFVSNEKDMVGRSIFYGMFLIIIILNGFLFIALREIGYLYYMLTSAILMVAMASLFGVAFQYLYPEYPQINERVTLASSALIALIFSLFARSLLNIGGKFSAAVRPLNLLVFLTAANVLLSLFVPYDISTRLSVSMAFANGIVMVTLAMIMIIRGDRSAHFFIESWGLLVAGTMIWLLNLFGVLPSNYWTQHSIEIGAIGQSILLTFALVYRFNQEREQRIGEQKARLKAMEERKNLEMNLLDQANHHVLTDLPGRNLLESALKLSIQNVDAGAEKSLALVLLHFRGFDDINKTLGHQNADKLLFQLARRMNDIILELPDSVVIELDNERRHGAAHVEGVSFACAFHPKRQEDLIEQLEALIEGICQPIEFMGLGLDIRMVGGCSLYPDNSHNAETLLRHAFIAFDQSESGVNHVAIYSESINPYSERRLTLMTDLRRAIDEDKLNLNFQPQISTANGEVCGFEALLRWTHPEHGFIPPDEFIPVAEQTGLIKPLTHWVIDKSLGFCRQLRDADVHATMSINISAINLQEKDFIGNIEKLLDRHSIEPGQITLEVTETATMINPKESLSALRTLHNAGIRLAIDDFGTGHSSLSYIRKLPVDEIKIDKSFVMEMASNEGDATIVKMAIAMCQSLGFEVVAEGVENSETCDLLKAMGCDIMQGFHLGKPMPNERVLPWLTEFRDAKITAQRH